MRVMDVPRWRDERVLAYLAARCAGQSAAQIAKQYDVGRGAVQIAVNAVRAADAAESGEDVSGGYWT